MGLPLLAYAIAERQSMLAGLPKQPKYKSINSMPKQLSLEQIDEQAKGLNFEDAILHYQNFKQFLDDRTKELESEKEEREDKLLKLKNLNGNGK